MPLEFNDSDRPQVSASRVSWLGFREVGGPIICVATAGAIKTLAPAKNDLTDDNCLSIFNKNRRMARYKGL